MTCTAVLMPPGATSFRRIAGLPLIQRNALSAIGGGFDAVLALDPDDGRELRGVLAGDARTASIPVLGSLRAAAVETDRVALIPSDCLVDAEALAQVLAAAPSDRPVMWRGAGFGAVIVGPRAVLAEVDGPDSDRAARAAVGESKPFGAGLCLDVPDARAAAVAERALLRGLAAATAATDGPIARIDRALSTRISHYLVLTPIRPNHITLIGTAIGFAAAWWLAQGTYASGVAGTLLFWVAVILDGCDGEVARLTFRESRLGYLLDITTDNLVHAAIFVGIGAGYFKNHPGGGGLWLLGLLIVGFTAAVAVTLATIARHPPSCEGNPRSRRDRWRQRLLRALAALMNRDFAYGLLLLALIGRLDWFLWGAAFGTYAYTAVLLIVYRRPDGAAEKVGRESPFPPAEG